MAYYLHTGRAGELAMPFQSGDNAAVTGILDQIVADIGAGVGQWSLYDDLRADANKIVRTGYLTFASSGNTAGAYSVAASTTLHPASSTARELSLGSEISQVAAGAWRTITAIGGTGATGTINAAFSATPGNGAAVYTRHRGIVLRCNSALRDFFILIRETNNGRMPITLQVYETWDPVTHTGTVGGPEDWMRARFNGAETYFWGTTLVGSVDPKTKKVQYVLLLKDESFTLWLSGDPAEGTVSAAGPVLSDLIHIGHLHEQTYANDDYAIVHLPTTTYHSRAAQLNVGATAVQSAGCATVMRTLGGGSAWPDNYKVDPQVDPYFMDPGRANYDYDGRFVATPFSLVCLSMAGLNSPFGIEVVRGTIRDILCPVSTPDIHFGRKQIEVTPGTFVEHLLLSVAGNSDSASATANTGSYEVEGIAAAAAASSRHQNAWGWGSKQGGYQTGAACMFMKPRWFLLPLN